MILALSGFHLLYPVQELSTVIIADRSKSVEDVEMSRLVTSIIEKMEEGDQIGITAAGLTSQIELPLTENGNRFYQFETPINPHYTNIEASLRLAGSMLSNEKQKKVILITDGNENVGNMIKKGEELKRRGVPVDVIPIAGQPKKDVKISSFSAPSQMFIGETGHLSLEIDSSVETEARLHLYKNNQQLVDESISLKEGSNAIQFPTIGNMTGFHTYRAEVISDDDEILENNQHHSFSYVEGNPKVLIVEGQQGEADNLVQALDSSNLEYNVIPPELLPTSLSSYLSFQSIVFANVAATKISQTQMELIQAAVEEFGVGFIMTGGENSYAMGGYFQTPIEEILPVHMDLKGKKEIPSLALAIVLDKSGSMMGEKMALAKEAAARTTELLREKDTINVIAFDSESWEIIPASKVENKEDIINDIRSIPADGGTNIFPSLERAYENLKNVDAKRKHIILLTDGQSAAQMPYESFILNGKENGITLSTVSLGMDADQFLLESLAEMGSGRYYDVQDQSTIPTIFSRETVMMTRTYIEDEPFYPALLYGYEWDNLLTDGMPQMNAYIAASPKSRAQTILVSDKDDPVLTRWNIGLGKAVAYTSDLTGEWAGEWPGWSNWSPLWNDVLSWTFPAYQGTPYHLTKSIQGNHVNITVQKNDPLFRNLSVGIVSEEGENIDSSFRTIAPGTGEITFDVVKPGIYFIQLTEGNEHKSSYKTGLVIPYSSEFDQKPVNKKALQSLAEATNGKWVENIEDYELHDLEKQYERQEVSHLFLLLALLLFMIDIAVRRFRISLTLPYKWKINKPKKKTNLQKNVVEESVIPKNPKDKIKRENTPKKQESKEEMKDQRMDRLLKAKSRRKR